MDFDFDFKGSQGEFFPLNILFVKQDRFSWKGIYIFLEGFQGIPPLNIFNFI
jgi:hypothetical protein